MKPLLAKSASAGSGKTTALVFRYISLLLKGAKPSEIIALTFTVKAANNMKDRVISALSNIKNYQFLDSLSQELNLSREEVIKHATQLSNSILFSELKISTLDSFFSSILSKFCFYAGVPYGFETLENSDIEWLKRKFLSDLSESQTKELATYLSNNKRKLGYFFELISLFDEKNIDPKIVFKKRKLPTYNLDEKIIELTNIIKSELTSEREIKLVSFTSTQELASKTLMSFDRLNDHTWLKKKQFSQLAEQSFYELKDAIKEYFWEVENTYVTTICALLESFKEAKHKFLIKNAKLTFSDIGIYCHKLLCSDNIFDTEFLYFRLDSKINHILIDEFQDTSLLQYQIIKPLIDEISSGVGQNSFSSFFFVGDTKQSIYRFRGGFSQLFDYVSNSLKSNGLKVEMLNTNYRSDKSIVDFANKLFKNTLPSYEKQESKEGAQDGFVQVLTSQAQSDDDEINPLLKTVLEKLDVLIEGGANQDDIAILTLTNNDSISVLDSISQFRTYNATQDVNSKVITQKEAKAIINYIKYCYFGDDIFREVFLSNTVNANFSEVPKIDIKITPVSAVKMTIELFGFYSTDAIKLLEIASEYGDMFDFIENIDKNSTKVPEGESEGIRVLTVHKSKGLEFKYVICMDRIASKGSNREDILFEFSKLEPKSAYFRFANREHFDSEYKIALESEKELARIDKLNMLYVAFTRAEHAMFIIKKATNLKQDGSLGTYSGVFDLKGLEDCTIGKLEIHSKKVYNVPIAQKYSFSTRDHGRQKINELKNEEVDNNKISMGLALHYALELVDFEHIDNTLDEAVMLAKIRYLQSDANLDDVHRMAKNGCQEIVKNHFCSSSKYFKESSFVINGKFGRIDLLIASESNIRIVDYKSSKLTTNEHNKQVNEYKDAVTHISGLPCSGFVLPLDS